MASDTAVGTRSDRRDSFQDEPEGKFGTFGGVFTPTILTILGAILFLRTGWVVGNAGLGGALLVIALANVITLCTGLSISTVATNIRVRAGGAFSIISQSLGLEVGGSVSVPFYFAQAISVAFYVFAFSEGWLRIFPTHPEIVVVFGSFAIAFTLAFVSASLAIRAQYIILAILIASLVSVFLGSFPIAGQPGLTESPVWAGEYASGDFWYTFAIFFPAVTGVLAGVNMSGDLRDPRESIPKGTMAAILLGVVIYAALAFWFAFAATPDELRTNQLIIVDKALWGPAVLAGILAATFSSALTSLLGAPRVLQAIAQHEVLPRGEWLARETDKGEPRPAMYVTGLIGLLAIVFGLLSGGLDAIAPLMTMFFLITYAMLNGVVLIEQTMKLTSFRPMFRVPILVPLVGFVGCAVAMFLINPPFSIVSLIVIILVYIYISRRDLQAPWSDVRSGLFVSVAEWAARKVIDLPTAQERAWKPSLLVPVRSTRQLQGSYRFLQALTFPRGTIHVLGLYEEGQKAPVADIDTQVEAFVRDGIFARHSLLEIDAYGSGLRTGLQILRNVFFRPNILFIPLQSDIPEPDLQYLYERTLDNEIGMVLYVSHPTTALGREQVINVWVREQSPEWKISLRLSNLDLSLLLAYQVARNWEAQINLIMLVQEPADQAKAEQFLNRLLTLGRMPETTRTVIQVSELTEFLPDAPRADLNIFGLQHQVNLEFVAEMVSATESSCIFVSESGHESALA